MSQPDPNQLQLHRCTVCGTRWLLWPDAVHGGGWNLLDSGQRPGACCDNVAMADQIEHLRDIPLSMKPPASPPADAFTADSFKWRCECGAENVVMCASCPKCHRVPPAVAGDDGFGVLSASQGWQPIETAPKDGTPFLICWAPSLKQGELKPVVEMVGGWDEYEECRSYGEPEAYGWHPLPTALVSPLSSPATQISRPSSSERRLDDDTETTATGDEATAPTNEKA